MLGAPARSQWRAEAGRRAVSCRGEEAADPRASGAIYALFPKPHLLEIAIALSVSRTYPCPYHVVRIG